MFCSAKILPLLLSKKDNLLETLDKLSWFLLFSSQYFAEIKSRIFQALFQIIRINGMFFSSNKIFTESIIFYLVQFQNNSRNVSNIIFIKKSYAVSIFKVGPYHWQYFIWRHGLWKNRKSFSEKVGQQLILRKINFFDSFLISGTIKTETKYVYPFITFCMIW